MAEVLLRAELVERLGRRGLTAAVQDGAWVRLLRGTYVPGDAVVDVELRCAAVQRLLPPESWVADRCLLWLHGTDVTPPGGPRLEVVVPRGAVVPRRNGVLAREAAVPLRDRAVLGRGRVRVLRPARASLDLLRRLPLIDAVVVADAVQHAGLVTLAQLREEHGRHARLRGVRSAGRALDLSDGRAESPPESRLRLLLVLAGLQPVPQYDVRDAHGTWLARVDLAFPAARVAVEYDGRAVHERSDVFARDRQRQNALVRAGWTVLRYTAADLRRPLVIAAEVRSCLLRAA